MRYITFKLNLDIQLQLKLNIKNFRDGVISKVACKLSAVYRQDKLQFLDVASIRVSKLEQQSKLKIG